MTSIFEKVF